MAESEVGVGEFGSDISGSTASSYARSAAGVGTFSRTAGASSVDGSYVVVSEASRPGPQS